MTYCLLADLPLLVLLEEKLDHNEVPGNKSFRGHSENLITLIIASDLIINSIPLTKASPVTPPPKYL
ncbi:hypothetical protein M8J75_015958 [Diaphorina citri]|nr:hypothetical protein M8J75_015958 [Diaphorina citri]